MVSDRQPLVTVRKSFHVWEFLVEGRLYRECDEDAEALEFAQQLRTEVREAVEAILIEMAKSKSSQAS